MLDPLTREIIVIADIGELLEQAGKMELTEARYVSQFINGYILGAVLVDVVADIHELLDILVLLVGGEVAETTFVVGCAAPEYDKEGDKQ